MDNNSLEEQYPKILQKSLEGILQDIVQVVSTTGTGGNAVYIYFDPHHPEVRCPTHLIEQYPSGIPIVLQHRWRDLVLDKNSFHVTLFFDAIPTRLSVPWASIIKFDDKTVGFTIDMADSKAVDTASFTSDMPAIDMPAIDMADSKAVDTASFTYDMPANQPQGGNVIPLFPNDEEKEDD